MLYSYFMHKMAVLTCCEYIKLVMFPIVVVHHELNNDDDGWGFENL